MRRAEFMMVLAYATDFATGQPRGFALGTCVLGKRLVDLAWFDVLSKRSVYH